MTLMIAAANLPKELRELFCQEFPSEEANLLPALVPGSRVVSSDLRKRIEGCRPAHMASPLHVTALTAGLWQVFDQLEESHELAQSLEGRCPDNSGDYWHAIMHRREPDYGNSKYWFRQVGRHDVFAELAPAAREILAACDDPRSADWSGKLTNSGWSPGSFVDLCQMCADDEVSPLTQAARGIQWAEMLLLLESCWNRASGAARRQS